MSEKVEGITAKVPWALVILLSVCLGVFGTLWLNFLPRNLMSYYCLGPILCVMQLTAAPFIILIFTALFSKLTGKPVPLATLTCLYAIGLASSWCLGDWSPVNFSAIVASRHMNPEWSAAYVPWFMAPPAEITGQLMGGYAAIPWGEWLPAILYHWAVLVFFGLFFISIATLFRRQWIDVEKVPFPHTLLAYELVRRIPEEKRPLTQKLGRPFLLGIALGLAFQIPIFMTVVFPWFPDIYGWKELCASGQWYIRAGTPLASIPGLSAFQMHPIMAVMAYLAPLSISFNAWFWHLVYIVLMQVAYAMGYYTGIEGISGCGRYWCAPSGMSQPPFKFEAISYAGGLLGLAVINLILSRRYIAETFRAAFAKHSGRLDVEKNEALTYRNTYALLGTSSVLLIALFMSAGLGFVAAFLLVITYFLFWMGNSRLYGLAGIQAQGGQHGGTLFRLLIWPTAPNPPTREYVLTAYYVRSGIDAPVSIGGGSIFTGFGSYRMANLTGTSNSNVFKVMLTTTIITPVIVLITFIWFCYTYGGTSSANASVAVQTTGFYGLTDPAEWIRWPSLEPVAPYVMGGFLIVVALEFLHTRFMWFPFNAIGFIIGTSALSVLYGYWGSFLIAWVFKTVTLRVGGSKLYEGVGVPIAGGFVVGYMIALIFGGSMGVIRFFIPY